MTEELILNCHYSKQDKEFGSFLLSLLKLLLSVQSFLNLTFQHLSPFVVKALLFSILTSLVSLLPKQPFLLRFLHYFLSFYPISCVEYSEFSSKVLPLFYPHFLQPETLKVHSQLRILSNTLDISRSHCLPHILTCCQQTSKM